MFEYRNRDLLEIVPVKLINAETGEFEYFNNCIELCRSRNVLMETCKTMLRMHRAHTINNQKYKLERVKEFYILCSIKRDISCHVMKTIFSEASFVKFFSLYNVRDLMKFKETDQIPYRFTKLNKRKIIKTFFELSLDRIRDTWRNLGFRIDDGSEAIFLLKASCINKIILSEFLYRNKLKEAAPGIGFKYKIVQLDIIIE